MKMCWAASVTCCINNKTVMCPLCKYRLILKVWMDIWKNYHGLKGEKKNHVGSCHCIDLHGESSGPAYNVHGKATQLG